MLEVALKNSQEAVRDCARRALTALFDYYARRGLEARELLRTRLYAYYKEARRQSKYLKRSIVSGLDSERTNARSGGRGDTRASVCCVQRLDTRRATRAWRNVQRYKTCDS